MLSEGKCFRRLGNEEQTASKERLLNRGKKWGGEGVSNPIKPSLNPPGPHVSPQDNEEPPALPPRTPEGLQVVEEPVYEAEPEHEPENDYEDVMDLGRQEEEAEGDYEDVLEPEGTTSLSYQAGE